MLPRCPRRHAEGAVREHPYPILGLLDRNRAPVEGLGARELSLSAQRAPDQSIEDYGARIEAWWHATAI